MFRLSNKTKWNISRVVPFGIIWFVTGMVFLASDMLAMGDNPVLEGAIRPTFAVFVFAGVAVFTMGLLVGFLEMVFVNRLFYRMSLVKTIVYKFVLYVALFTIVIAIVYPIAASIESSKPIWGAEVRDKFLGFWGSLAFWSTGLQLAFSLLLSLIYAAVSENLGQSVLVNFFTGKYHRPKQEERIFLFLDMYDSTTIAEALGHIAYFKFLQRYYDNLANAVILHEGEVYQYIGDEIVITWPKNNGIRNANCVKCFFEMKKDLQKRANAYEKEFGYVPRFKGGMHLGVVTTGELGALKKEIVYTGDVLNTAARIQGLCKELNKDFLVSEAVVNSLDDTDAFKVYLQKEMELRGKKEKVQIFSIS